MAELSRWLVPLDPPPGGAFRLSTRIADRRPSGRWRTVVAGALAATVVAMLWPREAPFERELAAALAAPRTVSVERGAAWAAPTTHANVRVYLVLADAAPAEAGAD